MRKFHLALVIAAGLAGCEAATTTTADPDLRESSAKASFDPELCDEPIPARTVWDGKSHAPLPPPQTADSTVQIYDNPEDANSRWAFSTDGGKITSWLVFPASSVGALVQQVQQPVQQLDGEPVVAKTSVLKVRPPKGPRVNAFVLSAALRIGNVVKGAEEDSDQCPDDDEK